MASQEPSETVYALKRQSRDPYEFGKPKSDINFYVTITTALASKKPCEIT